jgi:heme/copper-type cytochrome/quinol oxidase subunit 2
VPSEAAIQQVWTLSLVIYLVVVVVVAVLLTLILLTARRIREGAAAIWTVGQKVANNTIQIALLVQTNHIVDGILDRAVKVAGAVGAIEAHSGGCPRCPDCVTGPARKGA